MADRLVLFQAAFSHPHHPPQWILSSTLIPVSGSAPAFQVSTSRSDSPSVPILLSLLGLEPLALQSPPAALAVGAAAPTHLHPGLHYHLVVMRRRFPRHHRRTFPLLSGVLCWEFRHRDQY